MPHFSAGTDWKVVMVMHAALQRFANRCGSQKREKVGASKSSMSPGILSYASGRVKGYILNHNGSAVRKWMHTTGRSGGRNPGVMTLIVIDGCDDTDCH